MNLSEYIKQSYTRPNVQVLKSLGASDELIEYLRTTPWNTNRMVLESFFSGGSSGGQAVVGTAVVGRDTVG